MAGEGTHQHLRLLIAEDTRNRRKQPNPNGRTKLDLGQRKEISERLVGQIDTLEADAASRPPALRSFDPSLVFRVPLQESKSFDDLEDLFARCGIKLVAREDSNVVIAFQAEGDLSQLREAAARFAEPRINPDGNQAQSTVFDLFQHIDFERIARYGRVDRVGARLAERIGEAGDRIDAQTIYVADLQIWHRGPLTRESIDKLRQAIQANADQGSRVCDHYIGSGLAIMRVKVRGSLLNELLEVGDIAEIDLPPLPEFNPMEPYMAAVEEFTVVPPPDGGPRVCVIDSGVNAGHPLLSQHIGHAESFHTKTATATDVNGHGTAVASVAVFGDVAGCFNEKTFASDVTLFSARILNDNNELDDEKLFITQVRDAVQFFKAEPYRCRVFNLSFGTRFPALAGTKGKQAAWAAQLDDLAREESVLFIVAAGNVYRYTNDTAEAERILQDYPNYLLDSDAGLCDPGTSALAITVGALAHSETPAIATFGNDDIKLPVARSGEPSPITRTGFGCGGAIKPEFSHHGGNLLYDRRIKDDRGLQVLTLRADLGSLFAWSIGTSIAAPRIAHSAARTWHSLEQMLGQEPSSNLVRAVLAVAADPLPLDEARFGTWPDERHLRCVGYGIPNEDIAIRSLDSDLILIYEGSLATDGFQLFEVPIPADMVGASGPKQISWAVAFDPRTNPRRKDYLAVELRSALFRDIGADDLISHYEAIAGDHEARKQAPKAIDDRRKCSCQPTITRVAASTLQRQEFSTRTLRPQDGETYLLMVTSHRNWDSENATQRFAVAVRLRANSENLYAQVRERVVSRIQPRLRF